MTLFDYADRAEGERRKVAIKCGSGWHQVRAVAKGRGLAVAQAWCPVDDKPLRGAWTVTHIQSGWTLGGGKGVRTLANARACLAALLLESIDWTLPPDILRASLTPEAREWIVELTELR